MKKGSFFLILPAQTAHGLLFVCTQVIRNTSYKLQQHSQHTSHNKWFEPFLVGLQDIWSINVLGTTFLIKIKDIVCSHFG